MNNKYKKNKRIIGHFIQSVMKHDENFDKFEKLFKAKNK